MTLDLILSLVILILQDFRPYLHHFWLARLRVQSDLDAFDILQHNFLHGQRRYDVLLFQVVCGLDALPTDKEQAEETGELQGKRESQDSELGQTGRLGAKHGTQATCQHAFGVSGIASQAMRFVGERGNEPLAADLVL